MNGLLLAAIFSWGCERANELGFTQLLKEYADSKGKSLPETKVRKILEKLYPYFYYQVIAQSNGISDPFDQRVVKAHWIGNKLLENIKPQVVKKVLQEMSLEYDKLTLAMLAKPLIENLSAHHNAYARNHPLCSVSTDGKFFYHLGEKRMKASPKDRKNLLKYGRK